MSESVKFLIEEVSAVAGKVNVKAEREHAEVRVEFRAMQEPRFFERFLKGRPAEHVPYVMSRICGVCSVVHLTCSIEAVEKALGLEPSPEIYSLRSIAKGIEVLQNNFIHVLMALPDFTGYGDVIAFSRKHPDLFMRIMHTNRMILQVYERICGRFIHTPGMGVMQHGKPVSRHELEVADRLLRKISGEVWEMADDLDKVWKPLAEGFSDPAPAYCVLNPKEHRYPFFSEELLFSDGEVVRVQSYSEALNEFVAPYSNSHYVLYRGVPIYVGSRARLQAYDGLLTEKARELVKILDIDFLNPFDNVKSQYVEVAWLADLLAQLTGELAESVRKRIEPPSIAKSFKGSGEGIALATAPRGVLIHHYKFVDGRLDFANIVTPTVINARHMEVTGEALVRWAYENGIEEGEKIKQLIAALVRAYDPCIPCSVH